MDKYFGEYKAEVVDDNDPKNSNRVKVKVRGLMDGIPKAHLPWAKYKSPTASKKGGSSFPAVKGTKVWVRFADGDMNDAYYTGGVIESKSDLPNNAKSDRAVLYESPDGSVVLAMNESNKEVEIKIGDYNTTLGDFMHAFFDHGHTFLAPAIPASPAPTSKVDLIFPPVSPPSAVIEKTFQFGDLK